MKHHLIVQLGGVDVTGSPFTMMRGKPVNIISGLCHPRGVSIFDTNGRFIQCFDKRGSGEVEFNNPCVTTIDLIGNLYISDTYIYGQNSCFVIKV